MKREVNFVFFNFMAQNKVEIISWSVKNEISNSKIVKCNFCHKNAKRKYAVRVSLKGDDLDNLSYFHYSCWQRKEYKKIGKEKNKKVKVSARYLKALQTKVKFLKGELDTQKRIVEFVERFNPRLFYRVPKNLIEIIKDLKEELLGTCKK